MMITGINRRQALTGALSIAVTAGSRRAFAQGWPVRNLKLLVGGAPGSVPDSLARLAADALATKLGQPLIIENRAGAGGIVAMQALVQSPADGYTLGLATISQAVFNSYLFSKLPYDPMRDLAPVSKLVGSSFVLAVHNALAATTLAELVALSKKEPAALSIGIPANGSPPHIAALLLMKETGLSATMIPFKTGPDALTAILRGDVQLLVDGPTLIVPQVESRAIKVVAALGPRRLDALNETPTVAEAGYPGATCESWMGLVAPRNAPPEILERLSRECRAIVSAKDYAQKLTQMSFVPEASTPGEFAALIANEHRRWGPILQTAGVKLG